MVPCGEAKTLFFLFGAIFGAVCAFIWIPKGSDECAVPVDGWPKRLVLGAAQWGLVLLVAFWLHERVERGFNLLGTKVANELAMTKQYARQSDAQAGILDALQKRCR